MFLEHSWKLGEKQMTWLTSLKIAIVEKDIDKLSKLMDNVPQVETREEMEEALYLIKNATELVYTLKEKTAFSIKQIKQNLKFINSTKEDSRGTLNIKS